MRTSVIVSAIITATAHTLNYSTLHGDTHLTTLHAHFTHTLHKLHTHHHCFHCCIAGQPGCAYAAAQAICAHSVPPFMGSNKCTSSNSMHTSISRARSAEGLKYNIIHTIPTGACHTALLSYCNLFLRLCFSKMSLYCSNMVCEATWEAAVQAVIQAGIWQVSQP